MVSFLIFPIPAASEEGAESTKKRTSCWSRCSYWNRLIVHSIPYLDFDAVNDASFLCFIFLMFSLFYIHLSSLAERFEIPGGFEICRGRVSFLLFFHDNFELCLGSFLVINDSVYGILELSVFPSFLDVYRPAGSKCSPILVYLVVTTSLRRISFTSYKGLLFRLRVWEVIWQLKWNCNFGKH